MPQALPFFFTNQAIFTLSVAAAIIYVMSVYVLPPYVELMVNRVYVTKL